MRRIFRYIALFFFCLAQAGCSSGPGYLVQSNEPIISHPKNPVRQLALFLDGTENDLGSKTNISVLSEIVKNQDRDNLFVFYNEGVGAKGDFIGASTGLGINQTIEQAYAFLGRHYKRGSKLYLFGLSRGAYAARILAGMIRAVGIYDMSGVDNPKDRIRIARRLFFIYKLEYADCNGSSHTRDGLLECMRQIGEDTQRVVHGFRVSDLYPRLAGTPYRDVEIKAMGLWDTVEALGLAQTAEAIRRDAGGGQDPQNIVEPNYRYLDQICNVQHVYQALSLDDNRANLFTPVIITSDYVAETCTPQEAALPKIEEVWFAGAHADMGGGYSRNENNAPGDYTDRDLSLSGISLNWMMERLKRDAPDLLPPGARVFENPYAYIHDAENGSLLYSRATRERILEKYLTKSRYRKLKIHVSVIERLARPKTAAQQKQMGFDSLWYRKGKLAACFRDAGANAWIFRPECPYIEVVH